MNKNIAYLLLGGNLQNVEQTFISVYEEVSVKIGDVISKSKLYKSPAWGFESQNDFLNQVIGVSTTLNPNNLLTRVLEIETLLGRIRLDNVSGYSSRVIDIDILYFNHDIVNTQNLKIPHPEIENRRFTLLPLVNIIPRYVHPILKISNEEMLRICQDYSEVTEI